MAITKETVYIKGDKNVEVTKADVTLGDILTMECANPDVLPKLKALRLFKFTDNPKKEKKRGRSRTVVSVLRIIECIHEKYPSLDIQNLGPPDIIVTY